MPRADGLPAPSGDPARDGDTAASRRPGASASPPTIVPFGDDAVLVDLSEPVGVRAARRAQVLARAIAALAEADLRLGPPVPGAASVLVPFDPWATDARDLASILAPLLADLPPDPPPPPHACEHVLPVRYGGEDGADLAGVASAARLTQDEVVELHAGTTYEVLFLGFAPGFAYLGELPERLALPRLATPRTRVPPGSVAIAGRLTAAYPAASPGGWRLLGRTDAVLFDPRADPPVRLRPGDRVRFVPR